MRLLIDGYNLLHATDLFGEGELAGTLQGAREALLGFLAERLSVRERRGAVIVFDAAGAPPGLPDRLSVAEIDVRFARGFADADAMIEHLLGSRRSFRGLTVVSGDRRVQRAARSAGAKWIGSREWLANRLSRAEPAQRDARHPTDASGVGTRDEWIARFSNPADLESIAQQAASDPLPAPRESPKPDRVAEAPPAKPKRPAKRRPPLGESRSDPDKPFGEGVFDPFPPGYGDDLLPPE